MTTQIGGYIAFDWSYIFFKTRYGTKESIEVEPLALDHIETYTPSPISMNCTTHDEDEEDTIHEHTTPLVEVLDYFLDEWDNDFQFDPVQETKEIGLGAYYIFEGDALIPNLIKKEGNIDGLWDMFFDGSRNKNC